MKALSVRQPWAWAIAHAGKRIENRSRNTHYRGRILIHASSKPFNGDVEIVEAILGRRINYEAALAHLGCVVAVATLHDAFPIDGLESLARYVGRKLSPWATGPYCWILRDVQPLARPLPARGALGLWAPSPSLVSAAMREARSRDGKGG